MFSLSWTLLTSMLRFQEFTDTEILDDEDLLSWPSNKANIILGLIEYELNSPLCISSYSIRPSKIFATYETVKRETKGFAIFPVLCNVLLKASHGEIYATSESQTYISCVPVLRKPLEWLTNARLFVICQLLS